MVVALLKKVSQTLTDICIIIIALFVRIVCVCADCDTTTEARNVATVTVGDITVGAGNGDVTVRDNSDENGGYPFLIMLKFCVILKWEMHVHACVEK